VVPTGISTEMIILDTLDFELVLSGLSASPQVETSRRMGGSGWRLSVICMAVGSRNTLTGRAR
jgi:hypothetical protein